MVTKPELLVDAEMIEMLAQRYHCTPSQVLREPAWLLRHVRVLQEGAGG